MAEVESWERFRGYAVVLLERRTGAGLTVWTRRIKKSGADKNEAMLRDWLENQGITGYPQQLLMFERFGYPDYLVAGADQLIDAQYSDRESLRPILDRILAATANLAGVRVQARKGYVTLVTPRRTFALIRATKSRVDLGFRLEGKKPRGRLVAAGSMPQEWSTVKFELASPADVDDAVLKVLAQAYKANL